MDDVKVLDWLNTPKTLAQWHLFFNRVEGNYEDIRLMELNLVDAVYDVYWEYYDLPLPPKEPKDA
jgi:hypothetical protein